MNDDGSSQWMDDHWPLVDSALDENCAAAIVRFGGFGNQWERRECRQCDFLEGRRSGIGGRMDWVELAYPIRLADREACRICRDCGRLWVQRVATDGEGST